MAAPGPSAAGERTVFRLRRASSREDQPTWRLHQDPDQWCGEWTALRQALDESVRRAAAAAPARLIVYDEDDAQAVYRDFDPD
jgi:hypothetical protein